MTFEELYAERNRRIAELKEKGLVSEETWSQFPYPPEIADLERWYEEEIMRIGIPVCHGEIPDDVRRLSRMGFTIQEINELLSASFTSRIDPVRVGNFIMSERARLRWSTPVDWNKVLWVEKLQ